MKIMDNIMFDDFANSNGMRIKPSTQFFFGGLKLQEIISIHQIGVMDSLDGDIYSQL